MGGKKAGRFEVLTRCLEAIEHPEAVASGQAALVVKLTGNLCTYFARAPRGVGHSRFKGLARGLVVPRIPETLVHVDIAQPRFAQTAWGTQRLRFLIRLP